MYSPLAIAENDLQKLSLASRQAEKHTLLTKLVIAEKSDDVKKSLEALEALYGFYIKYDFHDEAEHIGRIKINKHRAANLPEKELTPFYLRYSASLIYTGRLVEAQQILSKGILLVDAQNAELQSNLYFNKAFIYRLLGEYDLAKHFYLLAFEHIKIVEGSAKLLATCEYQQRQLPIETAKILLQLGVVYSNMPSSLPRATDIQRCAADILQNSQDYYSIVAQSELAKTYSKKQQMTRSSALAKKVLANPNIRQPQQIDMLTLLLNASIGSATRKEQEQATQSLVGKNVHLNENDIVSYVSKLSQAYKITQDFYQLSPTNNERIFHPIKLMAIYNALIRLHISVGQYDVAESLFRKAQQLSQKYMLKGTNPAAWKSARINIIDTYIERYIKNETYNEPLLNQQLVNLISQEYDHSPSIDSIVYKRRHSIKNNEIDSLYSDWIQAEKDTFSNSTSHKVVRDLNLKRDAFFTKINRFEQEKSSTQDAFSNKAFTLDIPKKTLVLRYVITSNNSFLLALQKRKQVLHKLPNQTTINSVVKEYTQNLLKHTAHSNELRNQIKMLFPYQHLSPSIEKIVIIADGAMHQFPFATLTLNDDILGEQSIVKHYAITHSYSIIDYLHKTPLTKSRELNISVFADPAFTQTSASFAPLTYTQKESQTIKQVFPKANMRIAMARAANNSFLMSPQSRQSTILHIATHGYFDPNHPELVGLVTAPELNKTENGFKFK